MLITVLFASAFFVCIALVASMLSIANYIFMGFGLMKMGETMGEKAPWLSWIPYANQYMLGKLGINNTVGILLVISNGVSSLLGMILGILMTLTEEFINMEIVYIPLIIFGVIIAIYCIAVSILMYIVYYKLYKKFSDKAVIMTIFTVLTGTALAPIFIFAIRNNKLRE